MYEWLVKTQAWEWIFSGAGLVGVGWLIKILANRRKLGKSAAALTKKEIRADIEGGIVQGTTIAENVGIVLNHYYGKDGPRKTEPVQSAVPNRVLAGSQAELAGCVPKHSLGTSGTSEDGPSKTEPVQSADPNRGLAGFQAELAGCVPKQSLGTSAIRDTDKTGNPAQTVHMLHLSDLHFGDAQDARQWHSQLADDLKNELDCDKLDALIVSGDIASKSLSTEYDAAKVFFENVMQDFGLDPSRLVLVPGNHDLNWDLSKKGYRIMDLDDHDGELEEGMFIKVGADAIRVREKEKYKARFRHFSEFYKAIKGEPYPADYGNQGMIHCLDEHNLLILGLNSAWETDHHFKSRASISSEAVSNAMNAIRDNKNRTRFAVWHHPLNSPFDDRITDNGFMERLATNGFSVCFHGHLHKADTGLYRYDQSAGGRRIHIVSAGTFGAPVKAWYPGHPLQYNLLRLSGNRLTVETRCRAELNGAWKPNAIWTQGKGKDPLPRYVMELPEIKGGPKTVNPTPAGCKPAQSRIILKENLLPPPRITEAYKDRIVDCCQFMDIDRLREKGRVIQVKLPEIFIPLYTNPIEREQKKQKDGLEMHAIAEKNPDIEDLMAKHRYLVVEGEAGSGKTTLMKHFAYMTLNEKNWKGLENCLPVLIFLKDVARLDTGGFPAGVQTAETILRNRLSEMQSGFDDNAVRQFCAAGKMVILLDGLDEIGADVRNRIVNSFADFRNDYKHCKIVMSGRPHGISGAVADRFGDKRAKILPFDMNQIEEFIVKWFKSVFDADSKIGQKTATDMIWEVRAHPGISELTENPLLLSAICILYHDGKKLPEQRADLYHKFVTNLLYRRFDDAEKVRHFLMTLAIFMHTSRSRGIDRAGAIEIMKTVYAKNENEADYQYKNRLDQLFDTMEPNSGLIKIDGGQYNFRHLTFQEFFTASGLVDKETDYSAAIRDYWDDEWYQEVIELYIGYLSGIGNRGWANRIVKEILSEPDQTPFHRWRLAARSFLDIHHSIREDEVNELAKRRLISVFDSDVEPKPRADAGEILGRLGDPRDLEAFLPVRAGEYELSLGKVTLGPFLMSKYPVSNQWFAKFVKDNGYENRDWWSGEGKKWLEASKTRTPDDWYDHQWNCPNAPVIGVSWYEADAFCRWLTMRDKDGNEYRLPDETQWEAAAAGFENREYAWGKGFDQNKCNTKESEIGKTSAVGIFKAGESPEGIADLSGNVWEWTCSDYHTKKVLNDFPLDREMMKLQDEIVGSSGEKQKKLIDKWSSMLDEKKRRFPVLRGGSWVYVADYCRSANRNGYSPDLRNRNHGFRLVLLPGQQ